MQGKRKLKRDKSTKNIICIWSLNEPVRDLGVFQQFLGKNMKLTAFSLAGNKVNLVRHWQTTGYIPREK